MDVEKIKDFLSSDDIELKELGVALMSTDFSVEEQVKLLKECVKFPFRSKMTVDLFTDGVTFSIYEDLAPDFAAGYPLQSYSFKIIDYSKIEYFDPEKATK